MKYCQEAKTKSWRNGFACKRPWGYSWKVNSVKLWIVRSLY